MILKRRLARSKEYNPNPNGGPPIGVDSSEQALHEMKRHIEQLGLMLTSKENPAEITNYEGLLKLRGHIEGLVKKAEVRKSQEGEKFYRNQIKTVEMEIALKTKPIRSRQKFPELPYLQVSQSCKSSEWGDLRGKKLPKDGWDYVLFEIGSGLYQFGEYYPAQEGGEIPGGATNEGEIRIPRGISKTDFFTDIFCQYLIWMDLAPATLQSSGFNTDFFEYTSPRKQKPIPAPGIAERGARVCAMIEEGESVHFVVYKNASKKMIGQIEFGFQQLESIFIRLFNGFIQMPESKWRVLNARYEYLKSVYGKTD